MSVLYGQWGRMKAWFQKVKMRAAPTSMQEDVQRFGDAVRERVRLHIVSQDLPWPPLKHGTITAKGHSAAYMDTLEYYRSIDVKVSKTAVFSLDMLVGPVGEHSGSGLSMGLLASYLEYGTEKILARPLWRPVLAEVENMPEFKQLTDLGARFGFGIV